MYACVHVCVFKLFMIRRASSGQPASLLSMSPCLLTGVEGIVDQDSWPFKAFVLLFNINSPLKFC